MTLRHVDKTLYVGDTFAPSLHGDDAFVVTVEQEEHPQTDIHIPLYDGPSHNYQQFEKAVDIVVDKLVEGHRVLVHCTSGINRSPAVAAAAHCTLSDDGVGQSMTKAQCGHHNIAYYFEKSIKEYCDE